MIAVPAGNGNAIALIETATGKERQRINGHLGPIGALAFAPDGKTLISGSADGTLLTWDLNPFEREVSRKDEKLSTKELESLWTDLAGDDGEQAYRAIRTLQLSPQQTAAFLKERVHAVSDEPETPVLSADTLQALRATEVLEYLDVAESKQALERLAGGAEAAVLTREAKAALEFQARRSASKKKP
jgi:hypothetical protein